MRRVVRHGRAAWGWVVKVFVERVAEKVVTVLVMGLLGAGGVWWTDRAAVAHEKTAVQATAVKAMTQGVKAGQAVHRACPQTRRRT